MYKTACTRVQHCETAIYVRGIVCRAVSLPNNYTLATAELCSATPEQPPKHLRPRASLDPPLPGSIPSVSQNVKSIKLDEGIHGVTVVIPTNDREIPGSIPGRYNLQIEITSTS